MEYGFWKEPGLLAQAIGSTRVALTNGCYDVLHVGHITFLKWFRSMLYVNKLCVPLVVAINSDASMRKLKGASRPVNSAFDRGRVLLALRMVDHVVVFEEMTPMETIKILRPIALAKGGDYANAKIVGEDFVLSSGGQVFTGPYLDGYSSTEILNRCKDASPVGSNLQTAPH